MILSTEVTCEGNIIEAISRILITEIVYRGNIDEVILKI